MLFNAEELITKHDLDVKPRLLQMMINEILATKHSISNKELRKEFIALDNNFRSWSRPFPYYFARAMYIDMHLKYTQHTVLSLADAMDAHHPQ